MKRDELDIRITAAVQAEESEIPAGLRRAVLRRIGESPTRRQRPWAGGFWRFWPAAAAAVLLALILVFPGKPLPPAEQGNQPIRTEFSVPEKNLTIIWVTSDDFRMGSYLE